MRLDGWLLTYFLESTPPEIIQALRQRVADKIDTTFARSYTGELSLAAALDPTTIEIYSKQATGDKFLITPQA